LAVAGPAAATGGVVWTPGEEEFSFSWASFGGPPLFVRLPPGVEVRFSYDGPLRWALNGPGGPLGRSDGRRAVAWREDEVEVGAWLVTVPSVQDLLLPEPPDVADGEVAADELLGRPCWRWTAREQVRWVDEQTGCLLAQRTPAGTLALTSFEPGAPVDAALFDLHDVAGLDVEAAPCGHSRAAQNPPAAGFAVPWWPYGALSYPVSGDPDKGSVLVRLNTGDGRAPSVWVGVAPLNQRPPVKRGVRSRRWNGQDCSLSLSWSPSLSDEDVDRVVASIPRNWP